MSTGVVIWVTGDAGRLDEACRGVAAAARRSFAIVDVVRQDEVLARLCGSEKPDADLQALSVERTGWLCHLLEKHGGAGIARSGASRRGQRAGVRAMAGAMIEVLVRGELPAGLEPPDYPEVELEPGDGEEETARKVTAALAAIGVLGSAGHEYSSAEEAQVKDRLEKLGYL